MTKYIKYSINTIEDIKMGSQGSQKDNEYALSYIAGSTLRGAFIGKYIKDNNISVDISEDRNYREKLLTGIRFLNAYPSKANKRSLPFPACFYADKRSIKDFNTKDLKIKIINELEYDIPEDYKRVTGSEFCFYNNDGIEGFSVEKKYNLHITTREEKGNLFRYEAISKGQTFQGIIVVESDSDEVVNECVQTLKDAVLYLGGSKGSGYGRCVIKDIDVVNSNPEGFKDLEEDDFDDEFYIYAASDIISRDKNGQIIGYIDPAVLQDILELDAVTFEKGSIQTQLISGYNNKWGCRLPQIMGIRSGSIMKYSYKGELKLENIRKLEDRGIGLRIEEGYGRIVVLDEFDFDNLKKFKEWKEREKINAISDDAKQQLQKIVNNIYRNAVKNEMDEKILEMSKGFVNRLSRNQIGKLIENSINARNKTPQAGKEYFLQYFRVLEEERKTNKKVLNQFEDSRINGIKLNEYLKQYISESDDIVKFKKRYLTTRRSISIYGIEPEIDAKYVFELNMDFIERWCKFILRNKEGKL